jgi:two-component system, NarL family, invasion response regulator UvrY
LIRVVVAEDHPLVREGIKKVVRNHKDIVIVGEAANVDDASELIRASSPDVVVLDLGLPKSDDLEALEYIHARHPTTPILVLSMHSEEKYALRSLSEGASGYITKSMAAEELVFGIRKLKEGGRYITSQVADLLAVEMYEKKEPALHEKLSQREIEVVRLIGSGMQLKQVAAALGITLSTVNTYRKRIFKKTNLASNAALIRFAIENRLIH